MSEDPAAPEAETQATKTVVRKSLDELRAERLGKNTARRPERLYTVCLASELVIELQQLTDKLATLPMSPITVDDDGERSGPPPRMSGRTSADTPEAEAVKARMREVLEQMEAYEGELRLVAALSDGEWRQWVDQHPPRGEKDPGYRRDLEVTRGYCNADALIDDLARYAKSWNGEDLNDGDWDMLGVALPEKKTIAQTIVTMYETDLDLPKWRSGLSASIGRGTASR